MLARIRWNPVSSSIGVFSDTFEARCVASYYAERMRTRLKQQYAELDKAWDDSYQVPIVFYLPENDKNWTQYTLAQQLIDKNEAQAIYNDPERCQDAITHNQAEFFLILDNPEEVWQNLNDKYPLLNFVDNNHAHLLEALHNRRQTAQTFSEALLEHAVKLKNQPELATQLSLADKNDETIFHRVIKKGLLNWLSLLLELNTSGKYFDLNSVNKYNNTLLSIAIDGEYLDIVSSLLSHGANPNQTHYLGQTTLHLAIYKGNIDLLRILINHGADVNVTDRYKNTPLRHALKHSKNHQEVVHLLLINGANTQEIARSNHEEPLLYLAARVENLELVNAILDTNVNVNISYLDKTVLYASVEAGHTDIVLSLLKHKADIGDINTYKGTPLIHIAAQNGHTELVTILLNAGIDINQKDHNKYTPLLVATYYGRTGVVALLLAQNAEVNFDKTKSPLIVAIENNFEEIALALLATNLDLNKHRSNDDTPLHHAIRYQRPNIVKILLDKDADMNTINFFGYSPLEQALRTGNLDIINLLLAKSVEIIINKSCINLAIRAGHSSMVIYLQQLQKNRELIHHPYQLIHQALRDYAHSFNEPAFFSQQTVQDKILVNLLNAPEFSNQVFDENLLIHFLHQLKRNDTKPSNTLASVLSLCRLLTGINYNQLPDIPPSAIADNPSLAK